MPKQKQTKPHYQKMSVSTAITHLVAVDSDLPEDAKNTVRLVILGLLGVPQTENFYTEDFHALLNAHLDLSTKVSLLEHLAMNVYRVHEITYDDLTTHDL